MSAAISSRTPEGVPNRCPVCGAEICLEPSQPSGDAPCPNCGTLLWFIATPDGRLCYESAAVASLRDRIEEIVCANLGVNREQMKLDLLLREHVGADSLDIVELIMELEEAEKIKTIKDLVDCILKCWLGK